MVCLSIPWIVVYAVRLSTTVMAGRKVSSAARQVWTEPRARRTVASAIIGLFPAAATAWVMTGLLVCFTQEAIRLPWWCIVWC